MRARCATFLSKLFLPRMYVWTIAINPVLFEQLSVEIVTESKERYSISPTGVNVVELHETSWLHFYHIGMPTQKLQPGVYFIRATEPKMKNVFYEMLRHGKPVSRKKHKPT